MSTTWLRLQVALLLACAASGAGCVNPCADSGLETLGNHDEGEPPETYVMPWPERVMDGLNRPVLGGAHEFRLTEDREIEGRLVRAGFTVWALELEGSWLRGAIFSKAEYWRSDFAFVQRHGDATYTRLDLETDEEAPTPFTGVSHEYLKDVFGTGPDPHDPDLLVIGFLDHGGETLAVRGRARGIEPLDHAWVVHHVNMAGQPYDVLYDPAGKPLSPELPPLVHMGGSVWAARTEPARDLFWPIQEGGVVFPKPQAWLSGAQSWGAR